MVLQDPRRWNQGQGMDIDGRDGTMPEVEVPSTLSTWVPGSILASTMPIDMEADKDHLTPLPDKDGWEFYLPPLPN
eukprot:15365860-Ditylum_brightwellii.AAC.2